MVRTRLMTTRLPLRTVRIGLICSRVPIRAVMSLMRSPRRKNSSVAGMKNCLEYIWNKQDEAGRWKLEYDYAGKTWLSYGSKGQPNPRVTIRALLVFKYFKKG